MSFLRLLGSLRSLDPMVLRTGTNVELLAALPDPVLPYVLLNVLLAITMHDRDAASGLLGIDAGSALASANGVGGGSWQARPRRRPRAHHTPCALPRT